MTSPIRLRYSDCVYACYFFSCTLIYLISHGAGILINWYNPDDWLNRNGIVWIGTEGRWFPDVIFKYLFDYNPSNILQFIYSSLFYSVGCYFLLKNYFCIKSNFYTYLLVFTACISHPYQVDILNFDISISAYSFSFFIAIYAGIMMNKNKLSPLQYIISIILCSISISTYQPIIACVFYPLGLRILNNFEEVNFRLELSITARIIFIVMLSVFLSTFIGIKYAEYFTSGVSSRLEVNPVSLQEMTSLLLNFPLELVEHQAAFHPIVNKMYTYFILILMMVMAYLFLLLTVRKRGTIFITFHLIFLLLPVFGLKLCLDILGVLSPVRILYLSNVGLFLALIALIYRFNMLTLFKLESASKLLLVLLLLVSTITNNLIWLNQKKSYEYDLELTKYIYKDIEKLGRKRLLDINDTDILIYGVMRAKTPVAERFLSVGKTVYNSGAFIEVFENLYGLNVIRIVDENIVEDKCSSNKNNFILEKLEICLNEYDNMTFHMLD